MWVLAEEVIKHLLLTVVSGVDPVSCSHPNTPGDHCSLPKSSQVIKWWFFFFFTVLGWGEAPILWPPDAKSQLFGKDSDAGKDWGQEEKKTAENEMVGWHHWLDRHEFEQTPGDGEGQRGLACCSPCDRKELDMTKRLNSKRGLSLGTRDLRSVMQDLSPWLRDSPVVVHRLQSTGSIVVARQVASQLVGS